MQILRVASEAGESCWGAIDGEVVRRLPDAPYDSHLQPEGTLGDLSELEVLAPAEPSKIVCVGRNYRAHAAEHGAEVPSEPLLFLKPPSSVISHGAAIRLPGLSSRVEHEAELALVIGKKSWQVSIEDAWDSVLGITCANDVTARDLQRSDKQWTRGKGFDTFCPLGPWIETGLTEGDVAGLIVRCRVNGEVRQESNTVSMVFTPAYLIAYITQVMTLEPGDVVLTGTPAGVSPLSPGDEVEVEIDRVGTLRNPVVSEK